MESLQSENVKQNHNDRKILYVHVPKTAGMSFRMIMAEHFSGGEHDIYKTGMTPSGYRKISDFMTLSDEDRDQYKMFIGHFPHGLATYCGTSPLQLTCLRHPVKRVISLYDYNKRAGVKMPAFEQWLNTEFEASNGMVKRFNGWLEHEGRVYDYFHNRELDLSVALTTEHLDVAKYTLNENYELVMINERFSESLELLRRKLNSKPLFSLWYNNRNSKPENITPDQGDSLTEEKKDRELAAAEVNQLDIALYNVFLKQLEEAAVSADKDFKGDVEVHKELCTLIRFNNQKNLSAEDLQERINGCLRSFQDCEIKQVRMNALMLIADRLPANPALDNYLATLKKRYTLN